MSIPVGALNGLPAGRYLVSAKAQFDYGGDGVATASCELSVADGVNTVVLDSSAATLVPPSTTTVPWLGFTDLPSVGSLTLACVAPGIEASNIKLSAIQVETLTVQP